MTFAGTWDSTRRTLLLGLLVAVAAAGPRSAVAQSDGTLLKSDLVRMMTGESYSAEEVLQIVRMNCVGFTPSERDRRDLTRLFDGDELLNEIDRCRETGHSAGYRRGMPVAREVTTVARPAGPSPLGPSVDAPALETSGLAPPAIEQPPVGEHAPADTMPGVTPAAPPRLTNWEYVTRKILAEYRPDNRKPGEVVLRIWVDEKGRTGDASIVGSDADPALAEIALSVVPYMRFVPAESRHRSVGAWATLPIRFETN